MDDVLVLAPTRWKLRRAVRELNETFAALGLDKNPDKTFIGRVAKGFDFLGYHFGPKGLMVAKQTLQRFAERMARLCLSTSRPHQRLPRKVSGRLEIRAGSGGWLEALRGGREA